jgi:hypothetical protein
VAYLHQTCEGFQLRSEAKESSSLKKEG